MNEIERMIKEAYEKLKENTLIDDRRLFTNLYELLEDLRSEKPQTVTGRRLVVGEILKRELELFELMTSLEDRNMI